jgi:tetratricopeptide (TPR) repeat protein
VRELATAYQRVGDVQGDPYAQSMGNVDGALASYNRSRDLRQRLYDSGVRDVSLVRELAGSHLKIGDILWVKREFSRAKGEYERARALGEEALARDPSNTAVRLDLSIVLTGLGDTQAEIGDAQGALETHRQSLAIRQQVASAADPRSQRNVAVGEVKVADLEGRLGRHAAAIDGDRRATGILERLVAEDRTNAQLGSNLVATTQRLALALAGADRASEGVEAAKSVLPLARRLAGLDAENQVARRRDTEHARTNAAGGQQAGRVAAVSARVLVCTGRTRTR